MMTPTRPRVEGDREDEILEAAVELLLELGYDRLTMDAVAKKAHASKATLYRRWESKPELVIDALSRAKKMPDPKPVDTGTLRGDLLGMFCGDHGMSNERASHVMGAVITAVSTDPEFARLFRERFIGLKVAMASGIYQRAIERVVDHLIMPAVSNPPTTTRGTDAPVAPRMSKKTHKARTNA